LRKTYKASPVRLTGTLRHPTTATRQLHLLYPLVPLLLREAVFNKRLFIFLLNNSKARCIFLLLLATQIVRSLSFLWTLEILARLLGVLKTFGQSVSCL